MEHTLWEVQVTAPTDTDPSRVVIVEGNDTIATMNLADDTQELDSAYRITQAVNSHDQLVTRATEIVRQADEAEIAHSHVDLATAVVNLETAITNATKEGE